MSYNFITYRQAVVDPSHYNLDLWNDDTIEFISQECTRRLQSYNINVTIPMDQIRNVVDSVSEANPRVGTKEVIKMVISYIVKYIIDEKEQNKQTELYNKDVLKYDGQYGIQRMPQGQLGLKKKGLNTIGRMF
jgi:hypothetical protein